MMLAMKKSPRNLLRPDSPNLKLVPVMVSQWVTALLVRLASP